MKPLGKAWSAKAKKAAQDFDNLRSAAEKFSSGNVAFSVQCNTVNISYYEQSTPKLFYDKFLSYYAGQQQEEEQAQPSISIWEIKQEIILASIDTETLADLGKKLGVKL